MTEAKPWYGVKPQQLKLVFLASDLALRGVLRHPSFNLLTQSVVRR
jgi:hypothetical protein